MGEVSCEMLVLKSFGGRSKALKPCFFGPSGHRRKRAPRNCVFYGSFVITRGVHVFELEVAKLALE